MNMPNVLFPNFTASHQQMEDLGKAQSELFTRAMEESAALQKRQYDLMNVLMQNQLRLANVFFDKTMRSTMSLLSKTGQE